MSTTIDANGPLRRGIHDSLISVKKAVPPRQASRYILTIGEAAVGRIPLISVDFMAESHHEVECRLSLKFRADDFPKLAELYRRLPRGLRQVTLFNYLARVAMFPDLDPQKLNSLVHELHATPGVAAQEKQGKSQGGGALATEDFSGGAVAEPDEQTRLEEATEASLVEQSIEHEASERPDPMAGFNVAF